MELIVFHLTRMDKGNICIAGIDPITGNQVRPVIKFKNFSKDHLDCNGGCVNMGKVIDIGKARYVGQKPELEDFDIDPAALKVGRNLYPVEFLMHLKEKSRGNLKQIFGEGLQIHGYNGVVDVGTGSASLGFLAPKTKPTVRINEHGKIRVGLLDDSHKLYLSLTDLRFYLEDSLTPNEDVVDRISRKIRNGARIILGMGLTRSWQKPGDDKPYHWVQVNNIHFEDDPMWQLRY
jgi:hypothetical protein